MSNYFLTKKQQRLLKLYYDIMLDETLQYHQKIDIRQRIKRNLNKIERRVGKQYIQQCLLEESDCL